MKPCKITSACMHFLFTTLFDNSLTILGLEKSKIIKCDNEKKSTIGERKKTSTI